MKVSFVDSWRPIAVPNKYSAYINDHAIYTDVFGNLRLLGTCGTGSYKLYKERQFVEFLGAKDNPNDQLEEQNIVFEEEPNNYPKYFPFVFFDNRSKNYHLYFSSVGRIHHFISEDGVEWEYVNTPIRSLLPFFRDPCVLLK